jgi:hypothetical protein
MLTTTRAIREFENHCYNYYEDNPDYYATGYIIDLPNQGYSIFWINALRMGGRSINF